MNVVQHKAPLAFAERAAPFLMQRECQNCGLIGMSGALVDGVLPPVSDPLRLMFTVEMDEEVVGVAGQTRPHTMVVSRMRSGGGDALAEKLVEICWAGRGFSGPAETADAIADRWCVLSGQTRRLHVATRVFELRRVIPPPAVEGKMIIATMDHLQLIQRWRNAFADEIGEPTRNPIDWYEQIIREKRMFIWFDQEPCAMTGIAGPTPNGIRINAVYTPGNFRGRGYASNLVAAVSNHQLNSGKRFCFLFTDIANPTSNKIYQQIGYTPVSDFHHWTFNQ